MFVCLFKSLFFPLLLQLFINGETFSVNPVTSSPWLTMHIFATFFLELSLLYSSAQAFNIKGFRYRDNKAISKWVEGKNGYALAKIEEYFPKQLSICFRGFPEWNRHGHRTNWVDFKLNIPDLRTKFSFLADFTLHSTSDIFRFQCGANDKITNHM